MINNISTPVKICNFTLAFLKAAYYAHPGLEKKNKIKNEDTYFEASKRHSANNNVTLSIYKSL